MIRLLHDQFEIQLRIVHHLIYVVPIDVHIQCVHVEVRWPTVQYQEQSVLRRMPVDGKRHFPQSVGH